MLLGENNCIILRDLLEIVSLTFRDDLLEYIGQKTHKEIDFTSVD